MIKVLIVEDEIGVRLSLEEVLKREGYEVFSAENGEIGIKLFNEIKPDLIILDMLMPVLDGLEVCKAIRKTDQLTPVIFLTARGDEVDKVIGLELGADDYLTKPFSQRELLARIKANIRRLINDNNSNDKKDEMLVLTIGEVKIDFKSYRAFKGDTELSMSAKEFELIKFLANNTDVPVSRDQLLDEVWGYESYPTTRTVDNFIARLRSKIEVTPDKPKHILTVHGVGYKFVN